MRKTRKPTSRPSPAQIRSRSINGANFLLTGIKSNIQAQSTELSRWGSFPTTRGHLEEALHHVELAINFIKKER